MSTTIILVGGLVLAGWLYFTKPGRAELAILEARIAALEVTAPVPASPPAANPPA